MPGATRFGAAAFIAICWATEWQPVMKWVPFYNKKYEKGDHYLWKEP